MQGDNDYSVYDTQVFLYCVYNLTISELLSVNVNK